VARFLSEEHRKFGNSPLPLGASTSSARRARRDRLKELRGPVSQAVVAFDVLALVTLLRAQLP
jgi:hypothetical protein